MDANEKIGYQKEFTRRTGSDLQSLETNAKVVRSAFFPLIADARSIIVDYKKGVGFAESGRIEIPLAGAPVSTAQRESAVQAASRVGSSGTISTASYTGKIIDIREAQVILNRLGYSVGPADGVSGKRTRDAIVKFQQGANIKPTGTIDASTSEALVTADAK